MSDATNLQGNEGQPSRWAIWYAANKEKRDAYLKSYKGETLEARREYERKRAAHLRAYRPEGVMLRSARARAKVRGQPCTITLQDVVIPAHCPILGLPLKIQVGAVKHNSPSLDRVDPAYGYVPGNVWVISHRANAMKSDASPAELVTFAKAILARFDRIGPA